MGYNLYPLTSEKATYIPLDVYGIIQAFTYSVANTAMPGLVTLPLVPGALLELYCPEQVILSFDTIPVVYAANSSYLNAIIIPANTRKVIEAPGSSFSAALITGTSAILSINEIIRWDKLVTQVQNQYG